VVVRRTTRVSPSSSSTAKVVSETADGDHASVRGTALHPGSALSTAEVAAHRIGLGRVPSSSRVSRSKNCSVEPSVRMIPTRRAARIPLFHQWNVVKMMSETRANTSSLSVA
jgi:hypothetical protein